MTKHEKMLLFGSMVVYEELANSNSLPEIFQNKCSAQACALYSFSMNCGLDREYNALSREARREAKDYYNAFIEDSLLDPIESMKAGAVYTGFYTRFSGKEYFFITDQKRATHNFCMKAAAAAGMPDYHALYKAHALQPASIRIKMTSRGRFYFDISGAGFGGYGSDDINDGKTVVIRL